MKDYEEDESFFDKYLPLIICGAALLVILFSDGRVGCTVVINSNSVDSTSVPTTQGQK